MTTSSSGPTWYDILGVAPDASPAEIKAAWRSATDKFEPGTGASQFRLFNEAADVLLDPARRTAYDAEVGVSAAPVPGVEPVETPAPVVLTPDVEPDPDAEPARAPDVEPVETPAPDSAAAPPPSSARGSRIPALGLLTLLPVLALASVVVALVLGLRLHHDVQDRQDAASAGDEASSVAARALTAVLGYDYRHMDADRDRALKFLSPRGRKDYLKTFDLLTTGPQGGVSPVEKTKVVITADVLGTGVVDASSSRVRVLVFVNQSTVKGTGDPLIFQNRVVATMVRSGDSWLLDNLKSY